MLNFYFLFFSSSGIRSSSSIIRLASDYYVMIINFDDNSEKLEKLKKYHEQINLTQTAVTKQEDIESIKNKV